MELDRIGMEFERHLISVLISGKLSLEDNILSGLENVSPFITLHDKLLRS